MASPFDYANNICSSRENIWDDVSDKDYSAFMVNRALSYHYDTVLYAQEMNQRFSIPNKWQYDYLRLAITTKKKRFSKWYKPEKLEQIEMLSAHYGINKAQMEQYLKLLPDTAIADLLLPLEKGGRHGRK